MHTVTTILCMAVAAYLAQYAEANAIVFDFYEAADCSLTPSISEYFFPDECDPEGVAARQLIFNSSADAYYVQRYADRDCAIDVGPPELFITSSELVGACESSSGTSLPGAGFGGPSTFLNGVEKSIASSFSSLVAVTSMRGALSVVNCTFIDSLPSLFDLFTLPEGNTVEVFSHVFTGNGCFELAGMYKDSTDASSITILSFRINDIGDVSGYPLNGCGGTPVQIANRCLNSLNPSIGETLFIGGPSHTVITRQPTRDPTTASPTQLPTKSPNAASEASLVMPASTGLLVAIFFLVGVV